MDKRQGAPVQLHLWHPKPEPGDPTLPQPGPKQRLGELCRLGCAPCWLPHPSHPGPCLAGSDLGCNEKTKRQLLAVHLHRRCIGDVAHIAPAGQIMLELGNLTVHAAYISQETAQMHHQLCIGLSFCRIHTAYSVWLWCFCNMWGCTHRCFKSQLHKHSCLKRMTW